MSYTVSGDSCVSPPLILNGPCAGPNRRWDEDTPVAPVEAGPLNMQDGQEVEERFEIGQDQEEEVEPMKIAPSPEMPSAAEVEEHRVSHIPFRSWCRECIEGKALGERRGARPSKGQRRIPVVGVDYFYMTVSGMYDREELEHPKDDEGEQRLESDRAKGEVVKCVMVRCSATKMIFVHTIPKKGAVEEARKVVKVVSEDLTFLGHARMIVRSDNEKALKKLVEEVMKDLKITNEEAEGVSSENSEAYDSQANGMTEIGI